MTPEQLTIRVRNIGARTVPDVLRPLARYSNVLIGAIATSKYMRATPISRRSRLDMGPLRIQTTRLARSLTGAEFFGAGREAISEIEVRGNKLVLTKGSRTPYAAVHEYGHRGPAMIPQHNRKAHTRNGVQVREHSVRAHLRFMNIPARPYLRPALNDSRAKIEEKAMELLRDHVVDNLNGVA